MLLLRSRGNTKKLGWRLADMPTWYMDTSVENRDGVGSGLLGDETNGELFVVNWHNFARNVLSRGGLHFSCYAMDVT